MNHISSISFDRRQNQRLAIQQHSRLQLTLDGPAPDGEAITGVTLTDISQEGLMASDAGQIVPGANILLEIPLVGWREAQVRWISGNRAGCRFTRPLSLDELRLAAASSERLAAECPKLAALISQDATAKTRAPQPQLVTRQPRFWSWRSIEVLLALTAISFLCITWLLDYLT